MSEEAPASTVYEAVSDALATLSVPYGYDGYQTATGAQLPDLFLVWFLVDAPPAAHADNAEILRFERVQISIYQRGSLTNLPDVEGAMAAAGWMYSNTIHIPFNPATKHFGLALEFTRQRRISQEDY